MSKLLWAFLFHDWNRFRRVIFKCKLISHPLCILTWLYLAHVRLRQPSCLGCVPMIACVYIQAPCLRRLTSLVGYWQAWLREWNKPRRWSGRELNPSLVSRPHGPAASSLKFLFTNATPCVLPLFFLVALCVPCRLSASQWPFHPANSCDFQQPMEKKNCL